MNKQSTESSHKKIIITGLLVSSIFIFLFLKDTNWKTIIEEITKANIYILSIALLSKFFGFIFMTERIRTILRPIYKFQFLDSFTGVAVGFTGNNILPFRIGELLKTKFFSHKSGARFSKCFPVLIFERLLDATCLMILVFIAVPYLVNAKFDFIALSLLCSGISVFYICLVLVAKSPSKTKSIANIVINKFPEKLSSRLTSTIHSIIDAIKMIHSPSRLLLALLLSLGYWLTQILSVYIWLIAFNLSLPWFAPIVVLIFVSLGNFLPSAPSNIGTYHYFLAFALSMLGVNNDTAVSVAIIGHAISIFPFTILFIPLCLHFILSHYKNIDEK
ncbi:lysylphosphatidylglycerol synthase transmembrane domain-containing protein [Aliikangiella sp. G2MR2-5]|uniref:lysylphosphatidylglycerol synthase transmembrane domain-containing protein n=1 Tax=Aliikangiella sp. G2MR2-5 TaxID=2788943 RepID=UPI0018AC4660|nr:lysylphosphatidylglycerol synthase transmembrane domain-containing protein [Aliikangiella sp. G2MR2-5]